ncbi:MAG: KEOPS complex N(6)-L-threonylcarbamoyladenine synthase Kae1 [Candidatus Nanoarchaeia archaeon]|jgi:glycoprotease/Kae1 family metallohydrolase|nr:KEOPS complex N(6)-L-threonylcarbamoyladenine synthase Kae1 [Candidatus Nanoarchaeia archaeon]|tara:strand:- start:48800 stop:49783 length:984 start_codon:yes stop_codon:yes gene_type:complete
MKELICLGIEGTAHTFGASIITSKGDILSDVRDMYTTKKGGIIPQDAAKHHKEISNSVIEKSLKEANKNFDDINLISFSRAPGLAPCLLATKDVAIRLAKEHKKDLIGVNHAIAHLTSGLLFTEAKDPIYIYVSGANTQILALIDKRFRILGETLDIGLGNALDKFGRGIELGFPAGPKIEELAKDGEYVELPYTVKGMDLTFSGIVTEATNKFRKDYKKEDLCFSVQETLFSMLTEVVERALAFTEKKEALLIGGVAANKRLVEMLNIMCKERGAKFYNVPLRYSGDQAVMIAWQGILEYNSGKKDSLNIDIDDSQRTDQVEVIWN